MGLCEEVKAEETGRIGRKAIVLRLNRKAFMSVVIDIGVEETIVGRGFFDGSVSVVVDSELHVTLISSSIS